MLDILSSDYSPFDSAHPVVIDASYGHARDAETLEGVHPAWRKSAGVALSHLVARVRDWDNAVGRGACYNAVGDPYLERARSAARRCERYLGAPARVLVPDLYDFN